MPNAALCLVALLIMNGCGVPNVTLKTALNPVGAVRTAALGEAISIIPHRSSPNAQTFPAGPLDKFTWDRGGGGDIQFEVSRTEEGFEIQVIRFNFKPVKQSFELLATQQPQLTEGLAAIFTGKLELMSTPEVPGNMGGTFPSCTLSNGRQVVGDFRDPEVVGSNYKTLLVDLEKFVKDSLAGAVTDGTKSSPDLINVTHQGCANLIQGALVGTWEERDTRVGCGWTGTISAFRLKTVGSDGVEIYEGEDKTESGGIVLIAPKIEPVSYRFDLESCILQQTKAGVITTALLTRTKGITATQYSPSSLELATCTDATCSTLATGQNGKAVRHVLKKTPTSAE